VLVTDDAAIKEDTLSDLVVRNWLVEQAH
jgi:hypothetical protein